MPLSFYWVGVEPINAASGGRKIMGICREDKSSGSNNNNNNINNNMDKYWVGMNHFPCDVSGVQHTFFSRHL